MGADTQVHPRLQVWTHLRLIPYKNQAFLTEKKIQYAWLVSSLILSQEVSQPSFRETLAFWMCSTVYLNPNGPALLILDPRGHSHSWIRAQEQYKYGTAFGRQDVYWMWVSNMFSLSVAQGNSSVVMSKYKMLNSRAEIKREKLEKNYLQSGGTSYLGRQRF